MVTTIGKDSMESTTKRGRFFRGSTRPFAERRAVNRLVLNQLRLYLAQQLFETAVGRSEEKALAGIPALPLIMQFFAVELGRPITERQARRYAATLSLRTTDIALNRTTTRGKEWFVQMLFDERWIRKIRTERCRREEQESLRYKQEEKRMLGELSGTVCRSPATFFSPFSHPGGPIECGPHILSGPRDPHEQIVLPCPA
jgi:hypothetical protein